MREPNWIGLMLRGDRRAGEWLVEQHYARIHRLLLYLTGHAETADDLTQQTFVRAWQGLPAFRREAKIATWLHRIAYHEYTHWLRSKRDHAPLEAAHDLPAPSAEVPWQNDLLPEALAQLPAEQRETFLLFYIQELSVREIAAILEVPKGTVKSRLHTARQRLRELLHETLFEPQDTGRPMSSVSAATDTATRLTGNAKEPDSSEPYLIEASVVPPSVVQQGVSP